MASTSAAAAGPHSFRFLCELSESEVSKFTDDLIAELKATNPLLMDRVRCV